MIAKDKIPEFKKEWGAFEKKCQENSYTPVARIIYKPEIKDSVSKREQRLIDYVVDTYLSIDISPYLYERQEKGKLHKKDTGKDKKDN